MTKTTTTGLYNKVDEEIQKGSFGCHMHINQNFVAKSTFMKKHFRKECCLETLSKHPYLAPSEKFLSPMKSSFLGSGFLSIFIFQHYTGTFKQIKDKLAAYGIISDFDLQESEGRLSFYNFPSYCFFFIIQLVELLFCSSLMFRDSHLMSFPGFF